MWHGCIEHGNSRSTFSSSAAIMHCGHSSAHTGIQDHNTPTHLHSHGNPHDRRLRRAFDAALFALSPPTNNLSLNHKHRLQTDHEHARRLTQHSLSVQPRTLLSLPNKAQQDHTATCNSMPPSSTSPALDLSDSLSVVAAVVTNSYDEQRGPRDEVQINAMIHHQQVGRSP